MTELEAVYPPTTGTFASSMGCVFRGAGLIFFAYIVSSGNTAAQEARPAAGPADRHSGPAGVVCTLLYFAVALSSPACPLLLLTWPSGG